MRMVAPVDLLVRRLSTELGVTGESRAQDSDYLSLVKAG